MLRFLKQITRGEKGQVLPAVLALLVLGGLAIVPSLNYAATSLNAGRIIGERVRGIYAADAGVEDALWSLENGVSPPQQLSENINQMEVAIQTEDKGTKTLYLGELVESGAKSDYLDVSSNITWVEGNRYKFEITVTLLIDQTVHLETTGARLPVGYHYEDDSVTRSDGEAVCEPEITQDGQGADLLNWLWKEWGLPRPTLDKNDVEFKLTFYITGEGSQEGHYAWVVADPTSIGLVGEITGASYGITATATRPGDGRTTAKIVAEVIMEAETTYIVSWQILT